MTITYIDYTFDGDRYATFMPRTTEEELKTHIKVLKHFGGIIHECREVTREEAFRIDYYKARAFFWQR